MRVQIFEQFKGGHHTNYIQHLLPSIVKLANENLIDEIVVTITQEHYESKPFHQQLVTYSEQVHFDPSLPEVSFRLGLDPRLIIKQPTEFTSALKRRAEIASNLVNSVRRIKPDFLISTTADTQSSIASAIKTFLGMQILPKDTDSVGIIHFGYSGTAFNVIDKIKDLGYRSTWRYSPWSNLLVVNPLIYEWILHKGGTLAKRISLVPTPVPLSASFDKETARSLLKIPSEGRYIGFSGTMDHRVAIPELVAAFRDAPLALADRLLLAGRLLPRYKKLLEDEFAELINCGRLILIDRYLSPEELIAGYCALDVVSIPYYNQPNLSENLLKAIATGRPVMANDFGYTKMIVQRFDVGWLCNVANHESLVATLKRGLEECENYRVNEKTARLIQFHHPENYAVTVLMKLQNLVNPGCTIPLKTWEWVLNSDLPNASN